MADGTEIQATDGQMVVALTHIAAVAYRAGDWLVLGVYPRGTAGLRGLHGSHWMFVPKTVRVGDEVLNGPGVTTYADPEYAEFWAARPAGF